MVDLLQEKVDVLFILLALRHVRDKRDVMCGVPCGVAQHRDALVHPNGCPTFFDVAVQDLEGLNLARAQPRASRHILLPVLGMNEVWEIQVSKLRFGITQERGEGRIAGMEAAFKVGDGDGGASILENAAEPPLALAAPPPCVCAR